MCCGGHNLSGSSSAARFPCSRRLFGNQNILDSTPASPPTSAGSDSAIDPFDGHPADLLVPRGSSGLLRHGMSACPPFCVPFSATADPWPATVFDEVETRTRNFQDTAPQVFAIGATFRHLVIEACRGGWAPALRKVVSWIAVRGVSGVACQEVSLKFAQRISCTCTGNARAAAGGMVSWLRCGVLLLPSCLVLCRLVASLVPCFPRGRRSYRSIVTLIFLWPSRPPGFESACPSPISFEQVPGAQLLRPLSFQRFFTWFCPHLVPSSGKVCFQP